MREKELYEVFLVSPTPAKPYLAWGITAFLCATQTRPPYPPPSQATLCH